MISIIKGYLTLCFYTYKWIDDEYIFFKLDPAVSDDDDDDISVDDRYVEKDLI